MNRGEEQKLQRIVGSMQAAQLILKKCSGELPIEQRRCIDLLEVAQTALDKAVLAAWESAS